MFAVRQVSCCQASFFPLSWERKEAPMDRQQAADFPLLTRACQGDRRAMEILIEFCGTRMRRVIRKLCRKSPHLEEIIKDLTIVATASESRYLEQFLLQPRERTCQCSQANSRQLTHRLFDKVWPLVYGQDVPRPRLCRSATAKRSRLQELGNS